MRPRYTVPSIMGVAFLAAALAGCGGNSDAASGGGEGSGGQGSGGQQGSSALTITEPKNGADVTLPFTIKYTTSQQLGPTDSGKDHVHVFLDGNSSEYEVVPTTSYQVKNATPGKHEVDVTLQHADHSPVGPTAKIMVNVTGGGSGGGSGGSGGGGGYDYGSGGNGY
jgi:hypothetical protein